MTRSSDVLPNAADLRQLEISFRSVEADDEPFLFELFRSAHEYKFAPLNLPEPQLEQLLRIQFTAQEGQYRGQFAEADFSLVLEGGVPIGRLYVLRGSDAFLIIDVTLAPRRRNGVGGRLVREVLQEADRCGKPVRGHVEKTNRAWKLWRRMGFRIVGDDGMYYSLERRPFAAAE